MLALAAESRPAPSVVPELVAQVNRERAASTWTSTQDNAWMLLAARGLKEGNDAISLTVDGAAHDGPFSREIDGADLVSTPLTIANAGKDAIDAVVTTVAAPAQPLPAGGDGFDIGRTYYTLDGEEANVTEAQQNERYVVVLRVHQHNSWSPTCCPPASRSTIPASFPAPSSAISAGCRTPAPLISNSATTASSPPSIPAATAAGK
jgi:uncharacterized protein YfaS (alpha-2-macroglobulin family)